MFRKRSNRWLAGFTALCAMASALCVSSKLYAHGAWLGIGTADYTTDTQTLLQTRVNSGLGGFQNNDFIELIASFPVLVNGTVSGPNGYITFYVPPGTEVAGAWIVNAAGNPVSARPATALVSGEGTDDGWGPLGQPTFFTGINGWSPGIMPPGCSDATLAIAYTAANCASAMTHLYGDTGVFYSIRADTAMYTGGGTVISLVNGYQTNPTNAQPWPSVGGGGNERVHNKWDAVQTLVTDGAQHRSTQEARLPVQNQATGWTAMPRTAHGTVYRIAAHALADLHLTKRQMVLVRLCRQARPSMLLTR
jgi:hypothetical protein